MASAPTLLSLPPELLLTIALPLPSSSVWALTLTHPRLHALLNPHLFSLAPPEQLLTQLRTPHRLLRPVLLLSKYPAQLAATDTLGWTPLHWAARRGDQEVVEVLLGCGADVAAVTKAGRGPLTHAAMAGRVGCVTALLRAGAEVAASDRQGVGVLEMAVRTGRAEVVRELLRWGARGEGVWGVAVREGRGEVLEVLEMWNGVED